MERVSVEHESSGKKYEVFLSFRGPDTRQGLADVLYHALTDQGICVFRDYEENRTGEYISDEILSAIQETRIFVPIFSRNYASSKWCMIELAKMFEFKESSTSSSDNKKKILPIFYDVTVDDVKLKTELYKGDLSAHTGRFSDEIIAQWKEALKKAGKIKGWELKNKGYAEFAKEFVRDVSIKLKVKHKSLDEYFIPRDDQEDKLLKQLNVESYGVRMVGIHGMGGIGKTTLAKVVYNKLCDGFKHSIFLPDIRESSQQHKGIEHLQNKLLIDLGLKSSEITDAGDGIARIKHLVVGKKVLIVLDDVDHIKQIKSLVGDARWFGSGSRIIITSRDKSVLQTGGADGLVEVTEMNPEEAFRLFSMHAFDNDSPLANYLSVTEKAVASTGGLPLALEVIGSYLRNKKHEVWVETIERLKKAPHRDVQKKLMISYEALDEKTKQIFLDIACFFINQDKTNPTYMWEACGFDPDTGVEELINLSLIKIITKKKYQVNMEEMLWMHDQLRDLGRKIVDDENPKEVIKSRLWRPNDVWEIFENLEDDEDKKGNVEMIRFPKESGSPYTLSTKVISSFKKLRYLECYGAKISGDQMLRLPKLRWLSWRSCPPDFMGTDLHLRNLVILDLSLSYISETWGGWSHIQIGNQLKVLDLSCCYRLTKTPDLSIFSSLERLILEHCFALTDLDPSIGKLQDLKILNIRYCQSLKGFPEELCSLGSLEVILGHDGNFRLSSEVKRRFNMPESFGNLRSLSIFTLDHVRINKLPESIRMLVGLRRLSLSGCKGLQGLPELLVDMVSLAKLDLSDTDIVELPQAIERLEKLELLNLGGCEELKILPDSMGHLRSIVWLNLSGSGIKEIPSTINLLPNLSTCILGSRITGLPPKLPTSLTNLRISSDDNGNLNYHKVEGMEGMEGIGECHELVELELDVSISSIPKSLSSHSQLKYFLLKCSDLQSCPPLPPTLSFLHLKGQTEHSQLPKLSNLTNLSQLLLTSCSVAGDKIVENMGIRELESLTELGFSYCNFRNLDASCLPKCLKILHILSCRSLETIYGLSHLKSLEMLKLVSCDNLVEIGELGDLDSLQRLSIVRCDSLETIPNLVELRNLTDIIIYNCDEFKGIDNINEFGSLTNIDISGSSRLRVQVGGIEGDAMALAAQHHQQVSFFRF